MTQRPPRSTRTDTLFPDTTRCRSWPRRARRARAPAPDRPVVDAACGRGRGVARRDSAQAVRRRHGAARPQPRPSRRDSQGMNALAGHALVTGGGTGIGAAIARTLATAGVKVTLVGRRRKPLDAVADDIGAAVAVADVTDPDQVAAAFVKARAANGPLTILINNAGGTSAWGFL